MVKEIDPLHPTMDRHRELGQDKCPSRFIGHAQAIDLIGVNSMAGAASLGKPISHRRWERNRYLIYWSFRTPRNLESPVNRFGAAEEIEQGTRKGGISTVRRIPSSVLGQPEL